MPQRLVPPQNRRLAKSMRLQVTQAELYLWSRLRKPGLPGLRFRRQTPIGPFMVDFFCPDKKLIVEVDGDQHGFPDGERRDRERDAWLSRNGYRVLRFWNREVMTNIECVCEAIPAAVEPHRRGVTPSRNRLRCRLLRGDGA